MKHLFFLFICLAIFLPFNGYGLFPIEFVNDTQVVDDADVYVTIKGLDAATGKGCFVTYNNEGVASCVPVTMNTQSTDFSYRLSDLKRGADTAIVFIPYLASGRIYISIREPMRFMIDKEGENPVIVDADGFKPRDPNYYTLYDKVEFSYVAPNDEGVGGGTWMNPTAVDFFSLPIRIEQSGSTVFKATGLSVPRVDAITHLQSIIESEDRTTDHEWNKLWLNYQNRNGGETVLRLMSPGKAMIPNIPNTDPFNTNYLNDTKAYDFSWQDAVWDYYRNNDLVIDTRELQGAGYALNDYFFIGRVEGDNFIFSNRGDPSNQVVLPKPENSIPWFAGAQGVFNAENNTPKAIIVRQLTSAFDVGLLPAADGQILDRRYFDQQRDDSRYFQPNEFLPETAQGPWFDLYAMALHSFGEEQPIYAFAYDDALGQDGTLHDPNPLNISKATITIGDLTGTEIPNPFDDDRSYSVQILIGDGSSLTYQGQALKTGDTLDNVTIPMEVVFNGTPAKIYLDPQMVIPNFKAADGIVIELQNDTSATVIFPGLPKK